MANAPAPVETHIYGPTLMPRRTMPGFYERLVMRLAGDTTVVFHSMPERGGTGRTDKVLDALRGDLERARASGTRLRLAGHSLGGLLVWAMAHEYPDVIDEAELWAAPVRGTAITNRRAPAAEARFLLRQSRWLAQYDRPLNGPLVRSIYSFCDVMVTPARSVSFIEGDRCENHFVVPFTVPRWARRQGEHLHTGVVDHIFLPRSQRLHDSLARRAAA